MILLDVESILWRLALDIGLTQPGIAWEETLNISTLVWPLNMFMGIFFTEMVGQGISNSLWVTPLPGQGV